MSRRIESSLSCPLKSLAPFESTRHSCDRDRRIADTSDDRDDDSRPSSDSFRLSPYGAERRFMDACCALSGDPARSRSLSFSMSATGALLRALRLLGKSGADLTRRSPPGLPSPSTRSGMADSSGGSIAARARDPGTVRGMSSSSGPITDMNGSAAKSPSPSDRSSWLSSCTRASTTARSVDIRMSLSHSSRSAAGSVSGPSSTKSLPIPPRTADATSSSTACVSLTEGRCGGWPRISSDDMCTSAAAESVPSRGSNIMRSTPSPPDASTERRSMLLIDGPPSASSARLGSLWDRRMAMDSRAWTRAWGGSADSCGWGRSDGDRCGCCCCCCGDTAFIAFSADICD
eukprot:Opistho-2@48548